MFDKSTIPGFHIDWWWNGKVAFVNFDRWFHYSKYLLTVCIWELHEFIRNSFLNNLVKSTLTTAQGQIFALTPDNLLIVKQLF